MQTPLSWKRLLRPALLAALAAPLIAAPVAVPAAANDSAIVPVSVHGTTGFGSDHVLFSGEMSITPRIIDDPVFKGPPVLELIIDFSNVKGVQAANGKRFATDAHAVLHRPLLAFEQIEVTFPYAPADDPASSRTAKATIDITFNPKSGVRITSKISDP